jgi:hypothetical protein
MDKQNYGYWKWIGGSSPQWIPRLPWYVRLFGEKFHHNGDYRWRDVTYLSPQGYQEVLQMVDMLVRDALVDLGYVKDE